MAIVPLILGLLLIVTGIVIVALQKAPIEKWVGYNIAAAGLFVAIESTLATVNQGFFPSLHFVCLITLLVSLVIIICGYGKFIEDF